LGTSQEVTGDRAGVVDRGDADVYGVPVISIERE
jgi:hypothetical protein